MGTWRQGFLFHFSCMLLFPLSWDLSLLNSRYGICVGYLKWLFMDRDNGPPNDENDFSILISMTWCDSSFKDENEFLFASNNVDSHSPPPLMP